MCSVCEGSMPLYCTCSLRQGQPGSHHSRQQEKRSRQHYIEAAVSVASANDKSMKMPILPVKISPRGGPVRSAERCEKTWTGELRSRNSPQAQKIKRMERSAILLRFLHLSPKHIRIFSDEKMFTWLRKCSPQQCDVPEGLHCSGLRHGSQKQYHQSVPVLLWRSREGDRGWSD